MRDRMRRIEPNLDPNSCTEADFTYFLHFEYPKLVPSKNKAEWIERQMANEVIRNSILGVEEGRYGRIKSEEVENPDEYCKIVLEHKWNQLFKKEYDRVELPQKKSEIEIK